MRVYEKSLIEVMRMRTVGIAKDDSESDTVEKLKGGIVLG
jgi:hypothetical protein